eukprot:CAMPEP_0206320348 /NCGR_PEP_ID=MMETSP0106_2-20121207/18270_1 /ASSEMBLY_ACC=CAM_ASM_000206 /TAXON_ID=81532 /ORGANISM="Acanthoeca-like sp., Strain 10tr" /LENGTH=44 /DNA_ID= /DNA_START= /DNA_END= /DNA_ORIENTATION=
MTERQIQQMPLAATDPTVMASSTEGDGANDTVQRVIGALTVTAR